MTPRSQTTGTLGEDANPEKLAEQHYREGMKRFEARDLMGSIALLREAVRLCSEPGHVPLPVGHGAGDESALGQGSGETPARGDAVRADERGHLPEARPDLQGPGLQKRAEAQFRHVLAIDPSNRVAEEALVDMGVEAPKRKAGKDDSSGGMFSKLFKRK